MEIFDSGVKSMVPIHWDCVFYLLRIKGHILVPGIKPNGNLFISFSKNLLTASYVLGTYATGDPTLPHNRRLHTI